MMGISESAGQIPPANGDRFKPVAFLQRYGREIGLPVIVVGLTVLFAANSEVFLSLPNFRNIGVSAAALAAVSFGQTFAILTAGLDLSVGSIVALVSIVGAIVMRDYGIMAGMIASLATGAGVGLVNGIVITRFKVVPFIATLAMMSIVSGLALSLSGGVAVTGVPGAFADLAYELVLGIPVPVIIALMVWSLRSTSVRFASEGWAVNTSLTCSRSRMSRIIAAVTPDACKERMAASSDSPKTPVASRCRKTRTRC